MAAAVGRGRKSGRREISTGHAKVEGTRDFKAQSLAPADIGKVIDACRRAVYRYLSLESSSLV